MTSFYVYLIVTNRKKKYISYVGYTINLEKRIDLHNKSKGAKFTRGNKWLLAYSKTYSSKNIAMKEEYALKHNKKKRYSIKKKFLEK